jgi:hypothetical protein
LLTELDIIVIMWVNWSAVRRARLSAHCSTSPKRSAFDLLSCWSEWKNDWEFEHANHLRTSLPHQSSLQSAPLLETIHHPPLIFHTVKKLRRFENMLQCFTDWVRLFMRAVGAELGGCAVNYLRHHFLFFI